MEAERLSYESKIFLYFLKEKDLLKVYKREIRHSSIYGYNDFTSIIPLLNRSCRNYIDYNYESPLESLDIGFYWDESLKGYEFWKEVSNNYNQWRKNYNINKF